MLLACSSWWAISVMLSVFKLSCSSIVPVVHVLVQRYNRLWDSALAIHDKLLCPVHGALTQRHMQTISIEWHKWLRWLYQQEKALLASLENTRSLTNVILLYATAHYSVSHAINHQTETRRYKDEYYKQTSLVNRGIGSSVYSPTRCLAHKDVCAVGTAVRTAVELVY